MARTDFDFNHPRCHPQKSPVKNVFLGLQAEWSLGGAIVLVSRHTSPGQPLNEGHVIAKEPTGKQTTGVFQTNLVRIKYFYESLTSIQDPNYFTILI